MNLVAIARSERADYGSLAHPHPAPELPSGMAQTVAGLAIRDLFRTWGLDAAHLGTAQWNPLGDVIRPGARVLIKPNWVAHQNQSGAGMDCLVTHTTVLDAILDYVMLAQPSAVVIGDAPIQGCDFDALREICGLDALVARWEQRSVPVRLADFRRTVMLGGTFASPQLQDRRALDQYVLFDLGKDSLLEALAADADKFRVTMYNPDLLKQTHAAGKHQYLVAREVTEADVVINVAKLKCHAKAGITGPLKNPVGINGNKEYLPHHRMGGEGSGGDCYAGKSWLKHIAELELDAANRRPGGTASRRMLAESADLLARCATVLGSDRNLDGAWYGNDTVWRMSLDLQRVLRYGASDGSMRTEPQRTVVHITDAIIGGEGDGPLAPTPVASRFVSGSLDAPAAEWVHARLMGFDPRKIPLVRESFAAFRFPLTSIAPSDIQVQVGEDRVAVSQLKPFEGRRFRPPVGWQGHCEWDDQHDHMAQPVLVA